MATLAQLRVSDPNGRASFEIVVSESTTMFNVHRVLQFCIKPSQPDALIDSKAFTFTHVASGKEVRGPKSTQLYRGNPNAKHAAVEVGDAYTYEAAGKKTGKERYMLEVVAVGGGDDKYYVPRCVSGNINLDAVNRKLLTRRFRKTGPMAPKKPPEVWCFAGVSNAQLMASHLAAMQQSLTGF
ncbi:hypothetical protein OEZ85_003760 [Tetradesmus obliquus]|uniref:Uncharacterized protein n=1 Tax=Tetradesmus obliquus TaxID=3088 RepID=A0ABY8UFL3_TETOB|nr:hypothetical protein OEZ85_003760 [Tetradesmus obliquus]